MQRMNLVEQRLKAARNNAKSLVNTPNFAELNKYFQLIGRQCMVNIIICLCLIHQTVVS